VVVRNYGARTASKVLEALKQRMENIVELLNLFFRTHVLAFRPRIKME